MAQAAMNSPGNLFQAVDKLPSGEVETGGKSDPLFEKPCSFHTLGEVDCK